MFKNHRTLILTLVLSAAFVVMLPIVARATAVTDYSNFIYASYFTADYNVTSITGSASASGATLTLSATGQNATSGCNSSPAVSSTTTLTLTAQETVSVTCTPESGVIMSPPSEVTSNENGSKTFIVAKGRKVTFSVTATNGTEVKKTVTFSAVEPTVSKVPSDSAAYTYNGKVYNYLDKAIAAATSSGGTIAVTTSGKVYHSSVETDDNYASKSFTYTIPSGVTLLIPYNAANTLITNNMDKHWSESGAVGTEYCRLTMDSGTNIIVNGAICVGSQAARQMVGQVGPYGAIAMNVGSNITVKSGGNLYAYGYIFYGGEDSEGNPVGGTVTVESGGAVYESAFIMDYPGSATNTKNLYEGKVFPMRAFTIRNIEVPMTYHSGAKEMVFYCLYGTAIGGEYPGYFNLVGNTSDAPFCLNDGTKLTKSYFDGIQYLKIDGDAALNPLQITLKTGFLGDYPVTSSKTVGFPLPSGYQMELASGTLTLHDNFLMMEGTKLTIASGATLDANGKNIYVIDATVDTGAKTGTDVHGKAYTIVNTDAVLDVNGKLTSSGGFYTTKNEASIISSEGTGVIEITGTSTATEVTFRVKDGANKVTAEITPAQLKNADGTYTETDGQTGNYEYIDNKWQIKLDHDHVGGTATCSARAICTVCSQPYGKTLPHTCDQQVITDTYKASDATCTAKATYYYSCTCGAKGTETFEDGIALGHKYDIDSPQLQENNTLCVIGAKCDGCYTTLSATTENITAEETKATCVAAGKTVYTATFDESVTWLDEKVYTFEAEIPVDSNAHSYGEWVTTQEATCGADGSKTKTCTDCKTATVTEAIPATGVHNFGGEWSSDETNHWKDCTYCGADSSVDAHSWTDADCDTPKTCSVCGETEGEALGHQLTHYEAKDATCTENGNCEFYVCERDDGCQAVFYDKDGKQPVTDIESLVIPALDHTEGEIVVENEVAADCETEGSYDNVVYCTVCDAEISRETITVDALGHTEGEAVVENSTAATCGQAGSYDEVVYCTVCDEELSRTHETVETIPHSPGEAVKENIQAPTCKESGCHDEVVYCTVCDEEMSRVTVPVDALGHSWTDATCTTTKTCSTCGEFDGEALGHDWAEATCTAPKKCKRADCGETDGEALGHSWTDAGCDTAKTCNACGTTEGEKLGHKTILTEATEHNQMQLGNTAYYTCSRCNKYFNDEKGENEIEKDSWIINHKDDGHGYCELCQKLMCTHDVLTHDEGKAATCAETGIEEHWVCANCGLKFKDDAHTEIINDVVIPKKEHVYVASYSWVTDTTPVTMTATLTCSECDSNAEGHTIALDPVDATLNETFEGNCKEKSYVVYAGAVVYQGVTYSDTERVDGALASDKHDFSAVCHTNTHTWTECSHCQTEQSGSRVQRLYTVIVYNYLKQEVKRLENVIYGATLNLEHSASGESMLFSWVVDGQSVSADQVWETFEIDAETVELTVKEAAYKPGMIQMAVDYTGADSEKTMTVDLFISVESLAEEHKPIVKLGGKTLELKTIHESIMMYFVSIQFSAKQITQGGDNTKIEINYVYYNGDDTVDKTINSILIAYELALSNYIGDDKADATKQETAIEAVLNYGKAVQIYFAEGNYNWEYKAYDDTVIGSLANSQSPDRESIKVGDIEFTWKGANVQFKEAYSLRYEFEMTGLPNGVTPASAKIIVTDKDGNPLGEYTDPTIDVKGDNTNRFYAMYPVPASDIAKEDTVVKMIITLSDGTTVIETPEFKYGMRAYLTYSIHRFTKEIDPATGKVYTVGGETNQDTREKTNQYVQMLVSLLKLGETMLELESAS